MFTAPQLRVTAVIGWIVFFSATVLAAVPTSGQGVRLTFSQHPALAAVACTAFVIAIISMAYLKAVNYFKKSA